MKNRRLAQIVSDGEVQSHTDDLKKNYHTLRSERSSMYIQNMTLFNDFHAYLGFSSHYIDLIGKVSIRSQLKT